MGCAGGAQRHVTRKCGRMKLVHARNPDNRIRPVAVERFASGWTPPTVKIPDVSRFYLSPLAIRFVVH